MNGIILFKILYRVIQTLNKKDIFDFSLKKEVMEITDLKDNEILNFLSEYSSENNIRLNYQDIETCNIINKKKLSSSTSNNIVIIKIWILNLY